MPPWLLKLFMSLGRKQAAKRTGIAQIPTRFNAEAQAAELWTILKEAGFKDADLVKHIKSERDIIRLVNKVESMQKQQEKIGKGIKSLEKKKTPVEERPFQGFTPTIVKDKRAEFLKKYTKDGRPNDAELNALVNEHRILSEEAKRLGDAGENYEKFSQLNKRTDEIQEIIEFMRKEFPEDMASGGIARVGYAAGKIVKGASWVIKSLKKSRKEVIEGTGRFKNLNSMQQEQLKWELSALIKQLERGGKIPDDMLQTMRQDKRFKDVVKTPSTDPELRELEEVLLRGQTSDDYLEALDKSIMETMDLTKADLENMSSTVLDDLRRNADPIGMHKHFDEITPGRGVGDFPDDPSKHEDILPDLEQFDVTGKTKHASGGIAGELHLNEGGRVPMIFGGSAGLKGAIAAIKAAINKCRKTKIKTLFPKYSADEKELLKLGEKYLPRDAANLAAQEAAGKAEGVQVLIDRLKHDKKILEQMAKNKSMNDPGLDFMMKHLEETMYPPHLKKYKNIDKDILQLETIKKNLIMKGRRPNAEGGLAHVLGV